jgi:hypothetical protein
MTAKPVNQRVDEMRTRRKALGLTRIELYVHPEDHEAVKRKAASLQRTREKLEKQK